MGAGFESGLSGIAALVAQPPKLSQIEYNKYLTDTISNQALGLKGLRGIGDSAANDYAAALAASTPQIQALNQNTIGRLGSLADQYSGFDPTSTYERVRGGNIASLADQFVNLANYGQEADKAALAARGYGGRGPGSYESILRADRISKNIAPVLNTIYSNLGSDTAGLNTNRLANLAQVIPTLQYRDSLPGATDYRTLLPYQARLAMLGSEIPLSTSIAGAARANSAGFKETPNKWATFLQDLGRSMDQGFDAFTSIYGGDGLMGNFGGGGIGGMGGSGGGAGINSGQLTQLIQQYLRSQGGGGRPPQADFNDWTQALTSYGGYGGTPYGGFGGGSPSSFPY